MVEENIFDSMFKQEPKREQPKPQPKVEKEEEKAAAKKAANDKTKTYLYRLRPDFFNEVMCFSKLTNESINNIIEVALLQYLGNKENHDTFAIAQEMAKRLNNRK